MNHYCPAAVHPTGLPEDQPSLAPPGLTRNDSLFAMLDGQMIEGRRGSWRAEVVSILTEPTETWVQIGPAQRPAMSVLLRMGLGQRAEQALDALRAWTDLPEERRPWRIDLALRT